MGVSYDQVISGKVSGTGWRWVVLIGIFFIYSFVAIKMQLFSLINFELFSSTQTSTTTTAWIFNTFQFVLDMSAQFAGPLQERFGFRPIIFCCGLMMGLSSIVSAIVTIPELLFITYSIFSGTATGLLFALGHFILPLYFEKRLGFAIGVMMSGLSFGLFIGPILLTVLKNEYGKYARFFLGVLYFNICGAAIVLVSPRIASGKTISSIDILTDNNSDRCGISYKNDSTDTDICSQTSSGCKENSTETLPDCKYQENVSVTLENAKPVKFGILKTVFTNLKVLRYYKVLVIALSISLLFISAVNFLMIMPFALTNAGYSMELVTWGYIIFAICNFTSRLLIPSLSDHIAISKKWYILIGSLGTGVSLVSLTIVSSPAIILVTIGTFAFSMGCTTSLQSLLIIEFMGIDLLPATFGANGFVMSIAFLVVGPIIGIIRDQSASYNVTLLFISCLCFVSALLWILMPLALYLDNRKLTDSSTEVIDQRN